MARIRRGVLVVGVLCLSCAVADAQTVEICAQPGSAFGDSLSPAVLTEIATIAPQRDLVVSLVEVFVDIPHASIGDLTLTLESPMGTSITLHDGQGGMSSDLLVRYEDSGTPNGPPYDCNCGMQPSGPGECTDFRAERAGGDWVLTFADNAPTANGGTLDEWCLEVSAFRPIIIFECNFPALDFGDTGLPASVSDRISVPHNVVLDFLNVTVEVQHTSTSDLDISVTSPSGTTVTLHDNAGSGSGGVGTTFSEEGRANGAPHVCACLMLPTGPGQLADFVGEQAAGSWTLDCVDDLPLQDGGTLGRWCIGGFRLPDLEDCSAPHLDFGDTMGLPPLVSDTITVGPNLEIGDVEVRIDAIHDWIGDIRIDVTSPAGTNVVLHDQTGAGTTGIIAGYSDYGRTPGVVYLCNCFYPPAGPGVMLDFYTEFTSGAWTLTCEDVVPIASQGVFSDWCLRVYEYQDVFRRGDVDGNGTVSGLLDAIALLQWGFVGGTAPPCMDAADADGNNSISALVDALYVLSWAFLGGPPLPMPGPTYCGPDDDLDPFLDCAVGLLPPC